MQSTPNRPASTPVHPKIGRPPAALSATKEVPKKGKAPARHNHRYDGKLIMSSVVLVLLVTIGLSFFMPPSLNPQSSREILPELSPSAGNETEFEEGEIVGSIANIVPADDTVFYAPVAVPEETGMQAPIDSTDRERLLSILKED